MVDSDEHTRLPLAERHWRKKVYNIESMGRLWVESKYQLNGRLVSLIYVEPD
jgi:hypothetical protein